MNNFTMFKQFNYFQDDLLSSVGIRHTKEAGLRDCKMAIDSGGWNLNVWGRVIILVSSVLSYKFEELADHLAQVIFTVFIS